jgi:hypothetical protein
MSTLYSRIENHPGYFLKTIVFSMVIFLLSVMPVFADDNKIELRQGNFQSEQAAREELAEFARSYSNLQQWKARAKNIHEGILRGAELLLLPKKCPLNPIIHSKRRYDGYTIENVAFESLPGVFVTGNLYRPAQGQRPFAAVLRPPDTLCNTGSYGCRCFFVQHGWVRRMERRGLGA